MRTGRSAAGLMWGGGNQIEYQHRVIGLWGWAPATYEEETARRTTFEMIFGPTAFPAKRPAATGTSP